MLVGIKFLEEQYHKYVSHCSDAQIPHDDNHMFHYEENFGHEYSPWSCLKYIELHIDPQAF